MSRQKDTTYLDPTPPISDGAIQISPIRTRLPPLPRETSAPVLKLRMKPIDGNNNSNCWATLMNPGTRPKQHKTDDCKREKKRQERLDKIHVLPFAIGKHKAQSPEYIQKIERWTATLTPIT